jgi:chaperone modulatory protein CbpM
MVEKKVIAGVLMDEHTTISFIEICEEYDIPEEELLELVEYGIVDVPVKQVKKATFDYQSLSRIQSALRLKYELGINSQGIALALELLDKVEALEEKLGILQRHMDTL